uniref:Uncharacterized protein n=2 Tax=Lactuca sativa TaxID=4236 RepID=A0A9R1X442_LACSA|nr:hypothetical protein LSAT_V11C700377860 [Lactuca sativa]
MGKRLLEEGIRVLLNEVRSSRKEKDTNKIIFMPNQYVIILLEQKDLKLLFELEDHERSIKMTTEKAPAMDSCRKKKSDDATFLQDVKDHIDEFVHASMDEHKTCFKKTISKMFGMSKVVAERNAAENKGIESSLPLRTVVSD